MKKHIHKVRQQQANRLENTDESAE